MSTRKRARNEELTEQEIRELPGFLRMVYRNIVPLRNQTNQPRYHYNRGSNLRKWKYIRELSESNENEESALKKLKRFHNTLKNHSAERRRIPRSRSRSKS
jgi:hypothetical protein